jgi:hypothetical protein
MALQDHKGKWAYMAYDGWDSTTESLKGSLTHFSAVVDGNLVELNNTEITVKVGQSHQFALNMVQPPTTPRRRGRTNFHLFPSQCKEAAGKLYGK